MSSTDSCKDGASTKSDVCELNNMLRSMSTTDVEGVALSVCANCGKEGTDVTNTCNKCKEVMYCNAACKKKHRKKHKKDCERRVAELHDEALFTTPPSLYGDCPICFLRLPFFGLAKVYMACCGKIICDGCIHEVKSRADGASLCPFCRTPAPTTEREVIERNQKRIDVNDTVAMGDMGSNYAFGQYGLRRNMAKAFELWHRAVELGSAHAYYDIGCAYEEGRGVEMDKKKAMHYYELGAIGGNEMARHNLGCFEMQAGNMDRALKHFMIANESGSKKSLENIKQFYKMGNATKDDYANALKAYQEYVNETRSEQRDEAAADDGYEYI